MNYSQLLLGLAIIFCFGANAQNSEERKIPDINPSNNLANPASYADADLYKAAKAKGALVYERDYVFDGISANDVSQQLIDTVDPYRYLNQFKEYQNVYVDLPEQGLVMILFATRTLKPIDLNENE
ncbi:MAG: hypothetical protein DCO96_06780 [Fluviicola sp. XM-24bin1]|nr:MAG: hypothetical protein DCO96_06780 [Fluviicola sp. XM-24bin1]